MNDLYIIAIFNPDGTFDEYSRKGRERRIAGYDNIESARRGLAYTRKAHGIVHLGYTAEIVKVCRTIIVDGEHLLRGDSK